MTAPLLRIPGTEIDTPAIALGGNVFGWNVDEGESLRILDAFVDGGGRVIDTADVYSEWVPGHAGGESEQVIGRWLQRTGRRDDVVIATKVAKLHGRRGLAPANVAIAAAESLARLGIDAIDLYYAHEDDPSLSMEEIVGGFDALVRAGTIRNWGLSNISPERTQEALQVAQQGGFERPVAVQPHYNLMHRRSYEQGMAPIVQQHDLAVMPYFALASGFLTGKYDRTDAQATAAGTVRGGAVAGYFTDEGFAVVDALRSVAQELDATPASVALAWLAAQPGAIIPIASASRVSHVEGLLTAARLRLAPTHLDRLDAATGALAM